MAAESLAEIAPAETAVGHPTATARRLVNASLSDNTRRAYASAAPTPTPSASSTLDASKLTTQP